MWVEEKLAFPIVRSSSLFANPSTDAWTDALSFRSGSDQRTERFISHFEEAIALVSISSIQLLALWLPEMMLHPTPSE